MLVTIGSITTATRLARLIERNLGITAQVIHTPAEINKGGCSYSVKFNGSYVNDVRQLISEYSVPVKRYFECDGQHGCHDVP